MACEKCLRELRMIMPFRERFEFYGDDANYMLDDKHLVRSRSLALKDGKTVAVLTSHCGLKETR
jgi:hypothetical protein